MHAAFGQRKLQSSYFR